MRHYADRPRRAPLEAQECDNQRLAKLDGKMAESWLYLEGAVGGPDSLASIAHREQSPAAQALAVTGSRKAEPCPASPIERLPLNNRAAPRKAWETQADEMPSTVSDALVHVHCAVPVPARVQAAGSLEAGTPGQRKPPNVQPERQSPLAHRPTDHHLALVVATLARSRHAQSQPNNRVPIDRHRKLLAFPQGVGLFTDVADFGIRLTRDRVLHGAPRDFRTV